VLNAVSFLAVLEALRRMEPAAMRASAPAPKAKGQLREGLRYVWRTEDLRIPLGMLAVVATLSYNYQVLVPLLVRRELHSTDLGYTALTSVMSLGSVLGSLWLARRTRLPTRFLARACVVLGGVSMLLALAPTLALAAVAGVLVGASSIIVLSGTNAALQLVATPEMRGRVLALFTVVFLGSTPIGGPIAGWVAEQFGTRASLAMGAVAALVAGAGALFALDRERWVRRSAQKLDVEAVGA
jgi:MFS family permease